MSDKQGWMYNEVSGRIEQGDHIVATVSHTHYQRVGDEQFDADGRILAAAPALYAALEESPCTCTFKPIAGQRERECVPCKRCAALLLARPEGGQK